ncbi:hypothetical protein HF888_00850 [Bermanella marisrubri]|uniref:Lipoprotein n=1 Tax=Bermanella marisrubri TaxID=207949 RepID=Q1N457_9GAMM|nr:hypothetical protein [Bermanella marisrubri]EAT13008.1 hypothetical protein RED65_14967 [Oceanobacter sp. RED65] [Bermanella marisrubri]QIZ82865.1 hypothetical protein HF888_00850 [Bermanella marisrubri]
MKAIFLSILLIFLCSCSGIASISQPPSDEEIKEARKLNSPIALSAIFGQRNTANGIEVMITYSNISSKTMKYVTFEVVALNAVNDVVAGEIRGKKVTILKDTGPIEANGWSFPKWKNAIYHRNAIQLIVQKIRVEYMDGSIETVEKPFKLSSAVGQIEDKTY